MRKGQIIQEQVQQETLAVSPRRVVWALLAIALATVAAQAVACRGG